MALEIVGSNPTVHPNSFLRLQLSGQEHRSSDSRSVVPKGHFMYEIEQLCEPSEIHFIREVPAGNNPSKTV